MTANTMNRESARATRRNIVLAAVLTAAGFFMTLYSAATITGLIVRWLAHPY